MLQDWGIALFSEQGPFVSIASEQATPVLEEPGAPAHTLGLWDAVSIIVGIVIGAGIYKTVPFIFMMSSNQNLGLSFWLLGGVLSLVGSLCYAELACAYPRTGGEYVYLTRAFGPSSGFLFGWAQLICLMTGSIGMMAYIFADYAAILWSLDPSHKYLLASGVVIALTAAHMLGIALGKWTQNVLTAAKVVGLGLIILAGLRTGSGGNFSAGTSAPIKWEFHNLGTAMILIMYTYGGWNDAAFVAAEQRNPRRNIPLALLLGTGLVTVIYLCVNVAYLSVLGYQGVTGSMAIAADVLDKLLGQGGQRLMCLLVMISALGAVSGMIFTGSRVYPALGRDHYLFTALSRWHPGLGVPLRSLLIQAIVALVMILAVGTQTGQGIIDAGLKPLGQTAGTFDPSSGFDMLFRCTAPVFWTFFFMVGLSLFVLRWRDPGTERPFKVPLYPIVPLVFCASCALWFYFAARYAGWLAMYGLVPVLLGLPLYRISSMFGKPLEN